MKKIYALLTALLLTIAAMAQTLNVQVGSVTYLFPASQCGEMTYTDGTTLTIMNKAFTLSDISAMTVDETEVTDGTIGVVYDGTSAKVTVAGNVAQYVTPTVSGAHVSIAQSSDLAEEITYTLSGSSSDGEFYTSGSYKATIELNGLTLTNATPVYSGAAVHVQNSKRIKVKIVTGTTNTLSDASTGSQKGCLYIKGHAEFAQKGTLNVTGNVKHGIKAGEYISLKNATINVTSAVGDGINCCQFFQMESGEINISGTDDDGIQCDLEGDTSTGETTDHEDEDSGNIYISDGTVNITCTATAAKGIKCDGDMNISGGTISVTTSGNNGEGIESKNNLNITGGHITVNSYDDAINSAQDMTIEGGYVYAHATNNDGIDANGNCYIKGGVVYAIGASSPEVAIDANSEEQKKLYITGGTVIAVGGLESGASISGGTCKSVSSWTASSWHALYNGSDLALAFKTPASSSSGGNQGGNQGGGPGGNQGGSSQQLVVYTTSTPSLKSGVTISGGTEYFGGMANIGCTVSGGSTVTLSTYSGGNSGPGGH